MDELNAVRAAIEYSTEPRVAFFDDPAVHRVLGITMAVAQEVGMVLERLDTLERLLVQSGALQAGALQAYVPDPAVAKQRLVIRRNPLRKNGKSKRKRKKRASLSGKTNHR